MLSFDPNGIRLRGGHFINGRLMDTDIAEIDVQRPSDHSSYGAIPEAGPSGVDRAVTAAKRAFHQSGWATRPPRERARVMRRWAELIDSNVGELSRLEAVGSTRPISEAATWDIHFAAEGIRFFAEHADKLGGDVVATRSDNLGLIISEPYGVVAAIAPWNFPLVMASWKCGPALAAGNAVVLKPSELTPFSILRAAELAVEAGMPPGVFNVISGSGHITGGALVRHPDISKVTFTGSTQTGIAIMQAAAESGLKPVTLELGGKSPQIVFADVRSIDRVAETIARAITANAGQVCVAGTRLIVERSIEQHLLELVIKKFDELRPGATWSQETTLPPIVSARQAARIHRLVQETVAEGAIVLTGGGPVAEMSRGSFYRPTILTSVHTDMTACREEIFGPVLTVQAFDDEAEALALAEHPSYGLAAGVYTSDLNRALRSVRTLEAGTVWINRYGRSADFMLPTGGFNSSGIGKDLGRQAVEANLRLKTTLIDFAEA
ncbi:aldehyde dehydrogenase family protein [Microvirga sp. BT350]|uniref:Aldehyde dehydrogenase family protein n=1 Tax=Microvirga alba TaxID=2791025 RepID=A0A931BUD6_9HYPH|nr:aldehyde dehydrogenase family protein [Microvirga alba]